MVLTGKWLGIGNKIHPKPSLSTYNFIIYEYRLGTV